MWGPCVKWSVGMHWLGITVDHREKSHHWCDGRGCLESKELSVVKVRHQHTQGVIDGEMLEKCQGLVWDWHLQRRTEEALQYTHSFRVYSSLHTTNQKVNFAVSCPRAGTWSNGSMNLTQSWVSAPVVNLFLCLDCHMGVIPWGQVFFRTAMLTTARSLLYLCTSLSCLEQVNSRSNLLSGLPTSACVHLTAERSSTYVAGTNPPRGSAPKLGAMRPFSLHLQPLQSQMQHELSEQSLPLPSGARGGCSALPRDTEHLPTAVPNNSPAKNETFQSISWVWWGNGWNLLTLFLQEVRWYDPNSPFWLQNLWTSLWAYWGVSCTRGEPISSLG